MTAPPTSPAAAGVELFRVLLNKGLLTNWATAEKVATALAGVLQQTCKPAVLAQELAERFHQAGLSRAYSKDETADVIRRHFEGR